MIDFKQRYELLEKDSELSLCHQARLLGVDRWSYYYKRRKASTLNLYLMRLIDLYSRYIIAWDISNSMTAKWCKYVFLQALDSYPTPDILIPTRGASLHRNFGQKQ